MRHLLWIIAVVGASTTAGAQNVVLPEGQQITAATLPLPDEFRQDASVLGFRANDGKRVTLRRGSGAFVCLAPEPGAPRFHVACYHKSLEAFMARGRALRAQVIVGDQVDSIRFREVKAGKLKVPTQPAALYSLTGDAKTFNASAGTATGARPLYVVYVPGATAASTGLSVKPAEGTPWLMFPGTPKAHIMFVPRM